MVTAKYVESRGTMSFGAVDAVTGETVLPIGAGNAAVKYEFMEHTLDANCWYERKTAGGTIGFANHASGRGLELALTNANEIQLAAVDQQNRDASRPLLCCSFEARAAFSVLPTGSVVAVLGFIGDHNADPDAINRSAWFRWDGSGAVTVETDDGTSETSKVATGLTVTANEFHVYKVDLCFETLECRFYIDGAQVAASTTFAYDSGVSLQHYLRIGKEAAAAAVGTLVVDYCQVWQRRYF